MTVNSLDIVLLIAGFLLAWPVAVRFTRYRYRTALWFRGAGLGLFIIGQGLVLFGSEGVMDGFARRHWTHLTGAVIRSGVVGERAYRPNIVYQYQIDSQTVIDSTDLHPASFGGRNARRNTAETISLEFLPGDSITVWINPDDPRQSALVVNPFWADYVKISFGFGLMVVGLGGLVAGSMAKRKIPIKP